MIISSILCSRRFSLVKSHGCFLLEKRPSSAIYLTFLRTPPLPSQLKIWKHFLKISNNWVIKKEMLHIWIINLSINNTIFFFIVLALGSVIPHTSVIKWFSSLTCFSEVFSEARYSHMCPQPTWPIAIGEEMQELT